MNFNYNSNNFVNYEFKGKQVEQKLKEEEKKQEETKKEESVKPETVAPKQEKVTANALDVMAMQYKGGIVIDKGQSVSDPKSGGNNNISFWIQQWKNLPDEASYEDKLVVLNNIIDTYENDLVDTDSARIWRVIRYTLTQNECARQRLEFYQNITGHAISKIPDYSSIPTPEIYDGDEEALAELDGMWNELDDKQQLIYWEGKAATSSAEALLHLINLTNPQCQEPQMEISELNSSAWDIFAFIAGYNGNTQNADKPWKNIFDHKYYDLFISFRNSVYSGAGIGTVLQQVNQLQGVIEELREQGFPYCDELLISIQGHLVHGGYDGINVITPNGNGNGNASHKVPIAKEER